MAAPASRFSIDFDHPTLHWDATWTAIDATPNLVASYQIDRGRQYELDRTDTGRATVSISDPDGALDPTNPAGPYYTMIEPLLQAAIARWNPVAGEWQTRFRGFIDDLDYVFDPSQRVNRLVVSLVDLFEIVSAIELLPGSFGDPPPATAVGQVFYDNATVHDRIDQVLTNCGIPVDYYILFSGNVDLHETVYSPAESALTAVQEAADGEFPGVANVYVDRKGRLCFHGRVAKFDPVGVASDHPTLWDFLEVAAGDGAAVLASPSDTAQIRRFAFNRGLAKVINQALATPVNIADAAVTGQTVSDAGSIGKYGIRSWSAQNLITRTSLLDGATDLVETKRFASYYVDNYKNPQNRVTDIAVRSIRPGSPGAAATWNLLSKIDIADQVTVSVGSPGGGGFDHEHYFVEGVHEETRPLGVAYDDATVTLDLSPRVYYDSDPWPE